MFINKRNRFGPFVAGGADKESALNRATREFFSRRLEDKLLKRGKSREADLRRQYKKTLELAFAATLVFLLGMFQLARNVSLTAAAADKVDVKIEVADIPPTEQFRRPPPPVRPSVPIPTEEEDVPEDMTIASTELDLTEIPPPPGPPEEGELPIFVAYDEPPRIVGGLRALQKHLKYPRIAQTAGIEGVVFVKVLVSATGRTEKTEIIKSKPANVGFEQAAMQAIQKVKWHPAKQRDRNIRVWVSIPVQFKLVSS